METLSRIGKILVVVLALLVIGFLVASLVNRPTAIQTPPSATSSVVVERGTTGTSASGATCHISNGLPDPSCTPGFANPNVTQANISATICVSGFTTRIRPPASYTDALKIRQMQEYGLTGTSADYEEDHLIPLEVGGDPRDPRNLWPEPRGGEPNAGEKDRFENYLHREICAGRVQLADAQHAIATDWFSAWTAAGRP